MNVSGKVSENSIVGHAEGLNIEFLSSNCKIHIGAGCQFFGTSIGMHAPNCTLMIGSNAIINKGAIFLKKPGATVTIGKNLQARSGIFISAGASIIEIGDNCLFSSVRFRSSDAHPIFDKDTDERLNLDSPIKIGDHVWLAEDVLLLRNANIGMGSVVGARSTVTGEIPEHSLAVGSPARVVRRNIYWKQ